MIGRTRISSAIDVNRLSQAVSRPGIDPRSWVSLAIVDKVKVDPELGTILDITMLPSQDPATARVGEAYAGTGFGSHFPIQEGDEILVGIPEGDPNYGLIVLNRLYSPSDIPPAEAVANPEDIVIRVKAGQNIRIIVESGGNAVLIANDPSKVLIGAEEGTQPVALGTAIKDHFDALKTALDSHVHTSVTPGPAISLSGPPLLPFPFTPDVEADRAEVK